MEEISRSDMVLGVVMRKRCIPNEWKRFKQEIEEAISLGKSVVILTERRLDMCLEGKIIEFPGKERDIWLKANEIREYLEEKNTDRRFTESITTLLIVGFGLYVLSLIFENSKENYLLKDKERYINKLNEWDEKLWREKKLDISVWFEDI